MPQGQRQRLSIKAFKEKAQAGLQAEEAASLVIPKSALPEFKAVEGEENVREFIASDASVDRDGDTISVDGWELDNYRKGGSFLWGHDSSLLPVAEPVKVFTAGDALILRVRFPDPDLDHQCGTGFGYTVMRYYDLGLMKAVSVGFLPKEWTFNEERGGWAPMDFKRQELLEVSAVPVPANPNALLIARSKGIANQPIINWLETISAEDDKTARLWIPRDEIKAMLDTVAKASVVVPADIDSQDEPDESVTQVTPDAPSKGIEALLKAVEEAEQAESAAIDEVMAFAKAVSKRGRVLSAANESKLREACDLLGQVISQVEAESDDEDGKSKAVDVEPDEFFVIDDDPEPATKADTFDPEEVAAVTREVLDEQINNFLARNTGRLAQ